MAASAPNNQPLAPLELIENLVARTNALTKVFGDMAKLQQTTLQVRDDTKVDDIISQLKAILDAEAKAKVLHPSIWGELNKTYQHLKSRQAGLAMMLNAIKNKKPGRG